MILFRRPAPLLRAVMAAMMVAAWIPLASRMVAAQGAPSPARTLVLTRANLVDGASGAFATNATIVVTNGRIERIETGAFAPPAGAQVIDVGGRYVLPGLIDAHTHISSLASARRALETGVHLRAERGSLQDVALLNSSAGRLPPDVLRQACSSPTGQSVLADARLGMRAGVTTRVSRDWCGSTSPWSLTSSRRGPDARAPQQIPQADLPRGTLRVVVEEAATKNPVIARTRR